MPRARPQPRTTHAFNSSHAKRCAPSLMSAFVPQPPLPCTAASPPAASPCRVVVYRPGKTPPNAVERIRTLERKVFLKHESLHESIHCELKRHPHIVAFESCSTTAGTAKHAAKNTDKASSKTRQPKASRKAAKKAAKSGGGGGGGGGTTSTTSTATTATTSATAPATAAATARKGLAASSHPPAASGGNGVVGYLWYARQALQVDVQKVCVCPSRRRQGVGRRMMTALLAEVAASSSGSAVVRLHVAEENVAARGLYAGVGFHDVGRRVDYYREGRHARRMEVEVSELQERAAAAAAKEGEEGEGDDSGGDGSGGGSGAAGSGGGVGIRGGSSGGCGVVGSVGVGVGCGEEKGS